MAGGIICGVDESRGAREAARVASDLAERLGARLILLYVPPPLALEPPPGSGAAHERP